MIQAAKHVTRGISYVLTSLLLFMVVLTFIDVLGRRLFNQPVYGANDITEHLMALIVFAGLPLLTIRRQHLSVDLFDQWTLRPGWTLWHRLVNLFLASILAVISFEYYHAIFEALSIEEVSPALLIPRAWMYGFICACCGLSAFMALMAGLPHAHAGNQNEQRSYTK